MESFKFKYILLNLIIIYIEIYNIRKSRIFILVIIFFLFINIS